VKSDHSWSAEFCLRGSSNALYGQIQQYFDYKILASALLDIITLLSRNFASEYLILQQTTGSIISTIIVLIVDKMN